MLNKAIIFSFVLCVFFLGVFVGIRTERLFSKQICMCDTNVDRCITRSGIEIRCLAR